MKLLPWRKDKPASQTKSSAGVPAQGFLPTLGAMPSAAGVIISQATAMTVSTVYACVSIRSQDVARCKPGLWRPKEDGSREQVFDHPVAKLFKRPNRLQTWFEFSEQMETAFLLRGNAYAVALRDRRGNVTELIPVNPDAVMVLEASDGSIFYNVSRIGLFQMAVLRDQPIAIPAEDVLHLRDLSFNLTVGAGRIGLARDSIGLALAQEQQAARFVGNGARPNGLLKVAKKLSSEAGARLRQQWETLFSGVFNAGATAILEEGTDWQQLQLTSEDLEFLEQRKFSVADICRWYRMPPHKVGITDGMAKLNLPQADQDYVNSTIMPDLDRWEAKFERFFDLDLEGLEVEFDEEALLRADIMTRINVGRLGVMSGLTSANEWRRKEKLPPYTGGEKFLAPVNLAAAGSDMMGTASDGAGRPRAGESDALPEA